MLFLQTKPNAKVAFIIFKIYPEKKTRRFNQTYHYY